MIVSFFWNTNTDQTLRKRSSGLNHASAASKLNEQALERSGGGAVSIGDLLVPLLFAPERRVRRLLAFSGHARADVRGARAGQRPDRVDVRLERLERVLAGVNRRVQLLSERAGRRLQRLLLWRR